MEFMFCISKYIVFIEQRKRRLLKEQNKNYLQTFYAIFFCRRRDIPASFLFSLKRGGQRLWNVLEHCLELIFETFIHPLNSLFPIKEQWLAKNCSWSPDWHLSGHNRSSSSSHPHLIDQPVTQDPRHVLSFLLTQANAIMICDIQACFLAKSSWSPRHWTWSVPSYLSHVWR
jgi:hypothetical protein